MDLSRGMYASPISPYRSNFLRNTSVDVLFWNEFLINQVTPDGIQKISSIPIRKIVDFEGDHSVDIGWSTWHIADSIKQVIMHRLDRYLWTARIILISSGSNISIAGTIKAKTGSNWIKPELTGSQNQKLLTLHMIQITLLIVKTG